MKDQLRRGEDLSHGIRRIVRKQLARIIAQLTDRGTGGQGPLVHEARKGLKKIRAEMRLVQRSLGHRIHRRENRIFKKCAHALARQRDAEVLVRTLEKLCREPNAPGTGAAIASLAQVLSRRHEQILARHGEEAGLCLKSLRAARKRVKDWPVRNLEWENVSFGIEKTYRRGLKAFRRSEATLADECLHEWRKREKDLWCQLCLLEPIRPKLIFRLAEGMRRLSDALGNDHDLGLLAGALTRSNLKAAQADWLLELIRLRRTKLQRSALALGRRLYAEKPAAFARRIRRYGRAWRRR